MTRQPSGNRNKAFQLLALMSVTAIIVGSITLVVLYKAAFQSQSARLHEIVLSQARMIEAFNRIQQTQQPGMSETESMNAMLSLLQEVHNRFQGFGQTGGYTVAQLRNNAMVFLLGARTQKDQVIKPIAMGSNLAVAMHQALLGHSGVMIGPDYRGVKVLAAYEPIGSFHMGIVAKIDIAEFRAPFIKAGALAGTVSAILLLLTGLVFRRISTSMVESAELSESQLAVILDTVVDGIITIDGAGIITSYNSAAEKIFGYRPAEAIGKHVNLLIPEDYHTPHDQHLKDYMEKGDASIVGMKREVTGKRKNGSTFPMDLAVGDAHLGRQVFFTAIVRDITERKKNEQELQSYRDQLEQQVAQRTQALQQANEKLEHLARKDSLTGIANRREFDEELKREIRRAARDHTPLTLIICDIDYFKNYNDHYGHLAGDSCLTKIANTLYHHFNRAGDLVARYGGEEFAVILPNTDSDEAQHMADRLREAVWDLYLPHKSSKVTDRVTISCGLATIPQGKKLSDKNLIKLADDAMYQAKEQGRNRVVAAPPVSKQEQNTA